jgi:antitoxin (DNA-binding transcriptional repressor) of toxin-antitoxin stability system
MNTVTVRALRNSFPKVLATARKKGSVGITRRGKVVATLNAQAPAEAAAGAKVWTPPDFKQWLEEDFGGKIMPLSYVDFLER